jgi:hypothetical protein
MSGVHTCQCLTHTHTQYTDVRGYIEVITISIIISVYASVTMYHMENHKILPLNTQIEHQIDHQNWYHASNNQRWRFR